MQQFAADNADLTINSMYGNNGFHGMVRIELNTNPEGEEQEERAVKRVHLTPAQRKTVLRKTDKKIRPYVPAPTNGLNAIKFKPLPELHPISFPSLS